MLLAIALRLLFAILPLDIQRPATFAGDVRPILERRCTPCHFPGGKMYDKLPFDRPETITKLGTKLFTRIRKDDEQQVIRAFLAASARSAEKPKPQGSSAARVDAGAAGAID